MDEANVIDNDPFGFFGTFAPTLAERAADEGWETNEDGEDDDRGWPDYDEDAAAERALEVNMDHRDEADREAYMDGDGYNRSGTNPYYC